MPEELESNDHEFHSQFNHNHGRHRANHGVLKGTHAVAETAATWNHTGSNRRGTLLLAVLVCLMVATSLLTAIVQSALTSRRHVRSLARLAQVELLLQSGLDRAQSQLALQPEYLGETWRIEAEAFTGSAEADRTTAMGGAEITIRIDPALATNGDQPEVTPGCGGNDCRGISGWPVRLDSSHASVSPKCPLVVLQVTRTRTQCHGTRTRKERDGRTDVRR